MYPQPAHDWVALGIGDITGLEVNVVVTDAIGREVYRSRTNDASDRTFWRVNTSLWNPGIYFIRVTGGGTTRIGKLMVIK
jgi:hypothetical protein